MDEITVSETPKAILLIEYGRMFEQNRKLISLLQDGADLNTPDFMDWVADRLVNKHGDDLNADFVVTLRDRAEKIRDALKEADEVKQALRSVPRIPQGWVFLEEGTVQEGDMCYDSGFEEFKWIPVDKWCFGHDIAEDLDRDFALYIRKIEACVDDRRFYEVGTVFREIGNPSRKVMITSCCKGARPPVKQCFCGVVVEGFDKGYEAGNFLKKEFALDDGGRVVNS